MTASKKTKLKAALHRKPDAPKQTAQKQTAQKQTAQKQTAKKQTAPGAAKPIAKVAPAKKTLKKTPPKAKTAKKPAPKAVAPTQKTIKKLVHTPAPISPSHADVHKAADKTTAPSVSKKHHFPKSALGPFKTELLAMRERITGQSGSMRHAALQRDDEINPEEDGTDAFMRLQTLEQVGNQHRHIANIDEALRAIEKGTYGICEMCGELISKPRLSVLPFATNCITCQSKLERVARPGGRR